MMDTWSQYLNDDGEFMSDDEWEEYQRTHNVNNVSQPESIDSMQYADDGIRYDNNGNKWIEVDENNKPYNPKLRIEWAQRERTLENLSNDLKHERTERSLAQSEASYQRRRAQRAESRPRFF